MINFLEGIIEELEKFMSNIQGFILDNSGNPFMWLTFFLVGLALFGFVYGSLNKGN